MQGFVPRQRLAAGSVLKSAVIGGEKTRNGVLDVFECRDVLVFTTTKKHSPEMEKEKRVKSMIDCVVSHKER